MSSSIDRRRLGDEDETYGGFLGKRIPSFRSAPKQPLWTLWVRRSGEKDWKQFGNRNMAESQVRANIERAGAQDPELELGYGAAGVKAPTAVFANGMWQPVGVRPPIRVPSPRGAKIASP